MNKDRYDWLTAPEDKMAVCFFFALTLLGAAGWCVPCVAVTSLLAAKTYDVNGTSKSLSP